MAPVYDFRHVELDKIGRGKRIVKPPGGECSDIFGIQNGSSPNGGGQMTPRKGKNYMQSNIFSPDSPDSAHSNGHTPTTPAKVLDTQERLFGGSPDDETPRRVVNRQRSSIFEEEVRELDSRAKSTPVRRNQINPITGEPIVSENGTPKTPNGSANGTPNGSMNGSNGYMNGHTSPESPMNGNSIRVRNPPGGKSSGIF